jgi:hypothetical protein
MEIKKSITYNGKLKGVSFVDGRLIDEDGEIIELMYILQNVYGDKPFDISTTSKTEQLIDADDFHNGNDGYEDEDEE